MEKVVTLLRVENPDDEWCERIRGPLADELLGLDVDGLTVNVRDSSVRDSMMTLTTLAPPVAAVISILTQQSYGKQITAAVELLARQCDSVAAYLVTESVPMAPPDHLGERCPGLANVALLRRPPHLDHATWLTRWQTASCFTPNPNATPPRPATSSPRACCECSVSERRRQTTSAAGHYLTSTN